MTSEEVIQPSRTHVARSAIPDSWAWMRRDVVIRLLPLGAVYATAWLASSHARWLGLSQGRLWLQLVLGVAAAPVFFMVAAAVQLALTRRRGTLLVPAAADDACFQAAYYCVNGTVEEAFFRGLIQGGVGTLLTPAAGFIVGLSVYVLYHRLGWAWPDTLATALIGVPVGLAFWLLPGSPSLIAISLAHIAATCGFLGPGPYLLFRLKLL